jgi:hypothetical protein
MKTQPEPCVIFADRWDRGIIITFADGKCALYSASLLHGTFPQAEELKAEAWLNESQ